MSLLEIKKKIGGVKNTKKITKAMQLVAASKMQQFQKKAQSVKSFTFDLLNSLYSQEICNQSSVFTRHKNTRKHLFVLYTSDKGLCGPLNTKLINALFRSKKWNDLDADSRSLIVIGKKACEYVKNRNIKTLHSFKALPEKLDDIDALNVIDKIIDAFLNQDIDKVYLIAPHYKNSFTNYPVVKQFLPFSKPMLEQHFKIEEDAKVEAKNNDTMSYYPEDKSLVLDHLYRQIISSLFLQAFMELKAAEYSNRMIAMKNATDSADNMIKDLTRTYNKARQAAITQEIAELIGATSAME